MLILLNYALVLRITWKLINLKFRKIYLINSKVGAARTVDEDCCGCQGSFNDCLLWEQLQLRSRQYINSIIMPDCNNRKLDTLKRTKEKKRTEPREPLRAISLSSFIKADALSPLITFC